MVLCKFENFSFHLVCVRKSDKNARIDIIKNISVKIKFGNSSVDKKGLDYGPPEPNPGFLGPFYLPDFSELKN